MNVPWEKYIDHRFAAMKELFNVENTQRQRALDIAHREIDRRLETMNNLRAQVEEERGKQVSVVAFEVYKDAVEEYKRATDNRIRATENGMSNIAGRFLIVGAIVSLLGGSMGAAVVTFLLRGR